jgi:hypothetical protein
MKKLLTLTAAATVVLLTSTQVSAITNGAPDTAHDFVGQMRGFDPGGTLRRCSGSLISDGVFLTAGHCAVLSDVTLHFGDDLAVEDTVFAATSVQQHPDYGHSAGHQFDVGIVLFDQGDVVIEPGQLAPESYVDTFTHSELTSATFEAIGYGLVRDDTNGNSAPLSPTTQRMIATQTYLNLHNAYLGLSIHNNKGNGGGCFGDSGGPHLLHNYIVSVTSRGDANCVATDSTQRVDQFEIREWIVSFTD